MADVLPAELPSGTVAGVLSGRMDLVQEILVAGPDNIFAERARIRPQRNGNSAVYRLDGLPPGHYRLAPMGPGGASLATKPTIANVTVGTGAGTRVDFTVLAPL